MIYYLLLDRKERYPSCEDEDLPPRNDIGMDLALIVHNKNEPCTINADHTLGTFYSILARLRSHEPQHRRQARTNIISRAAGCR